MKIGILFAGDREFAPFLPMIKDARTTKKAMLTVYEGRVEGVEVAALFSGVCKVNAAVAAQILLDSCGCGAVINAGIPRPSLPLQATTCVWWKAV